jgi:hypothetical protein
MVYGDKIAKIRVFTQSGAAADGRDSGGADVDGTAAEGWWVHRPPLSPGVDLTPAVKGCFSKRAESAHFHWCDPDYQKSRSQYDPTVDYAEIRALATILLASVGCLPHSGHGYAYRSRNAVVVIHERLGRMSTAHPTIDMWRWLLV